MATFTKVLLSESVSGRQIPIVNTATTGNLIHTAHATAQDEVWLYAVNITTTSVLLTIEWIGVADAFKIMVGVPSRSGYVLVVPGLVITGGNIIRAFADVASVINVAGFVNRIT